MKDNLETISWPADRLVEAMEALARKGGLLKRGAQVTLADPSPLQDANACDDEALEGWIDSAISGLGLESESLEVPYGEVESFLNKAGPTILRIDLDGEPHFIALLKGSKRRVSVIGRDHAVHNLQPETLRAAICAKFEETVAEEMERLLNETGISDRHRAIVRRAILRERLSQVQIKGCWLLRLPQGAGFWRQMRYARIPRRLLLLLCAHTIQYVLLLISWWVLGYAVLQGRMDYGWMLAWALLLLTVIPFRLATNWLQGIIAIRAGSLLKQRLLVGALRLDPEEIRHQGSGQLLGRVIESSVVESFALSGGFLAVVAIIEIVLAALVLSAGAAGWLHALLLAAWVGVTFLLGWRFYRHRNLWSDTRIAMTNDLVERMVGHRTRLAQEARDNWHQGEDQALGEYLELSRVMDRTTVVLGGFIPRGWLLVGLIGLAPSFASAASSPAQVAISLGGILLAYQALMKLSAGLSQIAGAVIAWKQIALLFSAAARPEVRGLPLLANAVSQEETTTEKQRLIEAHDIVFRYRDRGDAVLKGCNLIIHSGDRLLLEGASGGGKSTLGSLLVGLRFPETGLLLVRGLDRQTLGSKGWRRLVTAAPQFHENHIITGTFLFNILMGRRWPPTGDDYKEAESVCVELGLGSLLGRMPAGMLQMVGETGWQLSHGERSRLFIARALLQKTDLIVLDESFAALDPETLRKALRCVLDRASTLLVIAHP